MEIAAISRRVSWSCARTVEVAPGWALGMPPPCMTHFITLCHIKKYLRCVHAIALDEPIKSENTLIYILTCDGMISFGISWPSWLCPGVTFWDNFSCWYEMGPNVKKGTTMPENIKNYYIRLYNEEVCTWWSTLL